VQAPKKAAPAATAPQAKPAAPQAKEAKPAAKPAAKEAPKAAAKEAPKATAQPVLPLAPRSAAMDAAALPERQPDPIRSVTAEAGMRVEVPLDGTGWTYLGEKEGREGVLYESRRFEGAGVVFALVASKPGEYLLRFQRQDALRGLTYDELVALKVTPKAAVQALPAAGASGPASGASGPAAGVAGSPNVAPAAVAAGGGATGSPDAALGASAPAAKPAPDSPEGMLLEAKNELGAGKVQGALDALDRLLARYPSGMDEAFYLYALALEQNGPLKDVKRAYALYKKVCSDYPQSAFWDKAAERVAYIERHYFEIR
jgi:tetratricopeptide (TPR) repeat protein